MLSQVFKLRYMSFVKLLILTISKSEQKKTSCKYFGFRYYLALLLWLMVSSLFAQPTIQVGAERLSNYLPKLEGKRIGLVVNASSFVERTHLVDTLQRLGLQIERIFTPEHGYRGKAEAGASVPDEIISSIPVRSLYGEHRKPPTSDLTDIDLLIFDLQDVGARFYTYSSTLHYVMEAAVEVDLPLLLLDRPNPNGNYIDGPILKSSYRSFVGMHPIPIVHGLTLGELALMINGEGWLTNGIKCRLEIMPVSNWTHSTPYRLPVRPSPNLSTYQAVRLYPSLCLFEGTVVSIGRGTSFPFEVVGYPDSTFGDFSFVPRSVSSASSPKHMNRRCYGVSLREYQIPQKLILSPLLYFYQQFPEKKSFFLPYFDKLAGTLTLRKQIENGYSEEQIRKSWQTDLQSYKKMREVYLLYPE